MSILLAVARCRRLDLKSRRVPYTYALPPRVWSNGVCAVLSALFSVLDRCLRFALRLSVAAIASFKLANTQIWSGQVNYA